jgi:FAD/FMN-containing dehydrogenase
MKLAASEGWLVMPAGALTWPEVGQAARRVDIVINTERLNRIIEHEPADLIAVTEAGVSLKNFNEVLMQKGQWLPLDPPNDGRATIGGVVATGLGGAQQFGYGPPRKHVIGMKVVKANGSLIKVGGRVVKNVAGYDLCKLFTGSYGTLGIIVEVNFKLRPLPFATRTVTSWGSLESLLSGAQRVLDARLFPVAVELLSRELAQETGQSDENDNCLLIRFAGNGVNEQARLAVELLECKAHQQPAPLNQDDSQIWQSLAALPLQFREDLVWRVGLLPANVPAFLKKLEQEDGSPAAIWQAGLADGRIRVMERSTQNGNKSGDLGHDMSARLESFSSLAKDLGATLIIEHAPVEIRHRINSSRAIDASYGIMQKIKQQLDPDGIFPSLSAY